MNELMEKEIIDAISNAKEITVEELSSLLEVSPSTIRRKLTELQSRGLIIRTRGGATINDEKNYYPKFSFRAHANSFEKKKIALSAIKLIKNVDRMFSEISCTSTLLGFPRQKK